ncbi:MAG: hypothetical protein WC876_04280 [Candidatus Thermoplasmatota archaeon]
MSPLLLAALLLHPALADDGHLRLVAVGTGDEAVEWSLDGEVVARTRDGEAARVAASAGPHELWASSASEGRWRVLARPDDRPPAGAELVPAWTAVHEPLESVDRPSWLLPAGAAVGSAAVLVRPRSLLEALRRLRRT